MTSRFLITTALEQSWQTDSPILFLGQWCKLYERRDIWQKLDFVTANYHWDDRKKLHKDHGTLRHIYEKMLIKVADKLNEVHGCHYSLNFWRIYIGPWLSYFTEVLYDRWYMINSVAEHYDISGSIVLTSSHAAFPSSDMNDFQSSFVTDEWNHWIFSEVLKQSKLKSVLTFQKSASTVRTVSDKKGASSFNKKQLVKYWLNKVTGILSRKNRVFISQSRLSLVSQFKLEMGIGQVPSLWFGPDLPCFGVDNNLRKAMEIKDTGDSEFEQLLLSLIPKQIPRLYLEGFKQHLALIEKCGWPENPRVLYTSNSYTSDENFKLYAGLKTEQGSQLVIAQHGGSYGVTMFNSSEYHIKKIADVFINWGWKEDLENGMKVLPALNLTECKSVKPNAKGRMLLATCTLPRLSYWLYSIPIGPQHQSYLNDITTFFSSLPEELFQASTLRLHPINWQWHERARFKYSFPNITFDKREKTLLESLSEYRLFVGTYDSTTHLESFSCNFPTILFWNPEHWEVRGEAREYYDKLKDVGILHDTPEQASLQITKIWNDVNSWWFSEEVQQAKNEFVDRFAKQDSNAMGKWITFFRYLLNRECHIKSS